MKIRQKKEGVNPSPTASSLRKFYEGFFNYFNEAISITADN